MNKLLVSIVAAGMPLLAAPASAAQASWVSPYVSCLAQMHPQQARALLTAATADEAERTYQALARPDERCIAKVAGDHQFTPDQFAVSMDIMRGDLAERVLLADEERPEGLKLQPLPLQQKRYLRPWFVTTSRHPAADEMAACMADTDPGEILQLVRTAAGSEEEQLVISQMSARLGQCLSAGTRLDASKAALRAALADALYQRINSPVVAAVEGPAH
jgi:hypothetical protein